HGGDRHLLLGPEPREQLTVEALVVRILELARRRCIGPPRPVEAEQVRKDPFGVVERAGVRKRELAMSTDVGERLLQITLADVLLAADAFDDLFLVAL